jgi:hypothetical protein
MNRSKRITEVPTVYRQGDVLIRRVDAIPAGTKPIAREGGRIVLAHGEVTGHSHAIGSREARFVMATEPSSGGAAPRRFLHVKAATVALRHEEHAEIKLPRGKYEISIQSEYHPEAIRDVAD